MPFAVRPLSPAAGAEITGIDLREELDDESWRGIERAWRAHHLLLFRNQELSAEQQVAFCRRFGPVSRQGGNMQHGRDYMHISNTVAGGALPNGELLFHSDHAFFETVMKGIALYAVEVPGHGGDTLFANAELAYEHLPETLKRRIAGLQARHVYDYARQSGDRRVTIDELGEKAVQAVHEVAWPHPETGRKILFVNEFMTHEIVGLPRAESEELLALLLGYIRDRRVIYQHEWRLGDLVIWDNRSLQHARSNFDPGEKRTLRRVPIAEFAGAAAA
jgi:taurine dioxygenase